MQISSRTPEGQPASCPVCGSEVCVEPSIFFGDATCPKCGTLIWFLHSTTTTNCFATDKTKSIRDQVFAILSESSNVNAADWLLERCARSQELDSLELVEIVMEFEEEFHGDYTLE